MSPNNRHELTEERPGRLFLSAVFERAKERNLSPSKRLVLCALFRYLGDKDFCFPSQQNLAKDTGLTERTVRTLLKELAEKDKIIEITTRKTTGRKHGNHANEYRFKLSPNENQTGNLKQNQSGNLRRPKRKSATTKPEIRDRQSGNLRQPKVPQKQASSERAGAEYVKRIGQENQSSNRSGKDRWTDFDKKTSPRTTTASKHSRPHAGDNQEEVFALGSMQEECFAPPPGAPPRLTPEQIKALFGGPGPRPQNLLDCPEGDFVLRDLTAPFKKGPEVKEVLGFDPNTLQDRCFEKALEEFSREAFHRHWNRDAKPPGPAFKRLFYQAGRSGLLYAYGFHPLSPEQQEMRRRELERQEEEEAEVARLLAKREARFSKLINRPMVRKYLLLRRLSLENHEAIKVHLRELVDSIGNPSLTALERFMKGEVRAEKAMKRRHEQIKELELLAEKDPRLIGGFVREGIIAEADDFIFSEYDCLDSLLAIGKEFQINDLRQMARAFINQTQE